VVLGEVFNFAAYAFAPAILVTPLGALSVLIGYVDNLKMWYPDADDYHSSVLGSYFLHERLGLLGKIGCAICLIGSVIIVLHAPPDKEVGSIDEILNFAIQPGDTPLQSETMHTHASRPLLTNPFPRFPILLCDCRSLLNSNDIQSFS
jgi:hypothetical protein